MQANKRAIDKFLHLLNSYGQFNESFVEVVNLIEALTTQKQCVSREVEINLAGPQLAAEADCIVLQCFLVTLTADMERIGVRFFALYHSIATESRPAS